MSKNNQSEFINRWWYLGHFFFGVLSGYICYKMYKDIKPKDAKTNLQDSVIITLVFYVYAAIVGVTLGGLPQLLFIVTTFHPIVAIWFVVFVLKQNRSKNQV